MTTASDDLRFGHFPECPGCGGLNDPAVCKMSPECEWNPQPTRRPNRGQAMRIKLPDETSWPRPSMERDENHGVGWTLRYGDPTRKDLIEAAGIIHAYELLLTATTQKRRNYVCREIRAALKRETTP